MSGLSVIVLALGMVLTGCGDPNNDNIPNIPTESNPALTGTVTVSSAVTADSRGKETADTSGLNVTNDLLHVYQWSRDGSEISGARSSSYTVTEADYGKTLAVRVTNSTRSGEQSGEIVIPSPTVYVVSVKYANSTLAGNRKAVIFETTNGKSFYGTANNSVSTTTLGTTAQTVILSTWNESQFKVRIDFTMIIEDKYYFKKAGMDIELFDLTSGTKSYELTFSYDSSFGIYYNV
ncbi:hypothetical protein FACS1894172_11800 [Spirochaetia bacterium]|nr:hypothetical protein FACS1894172_11800 [Spirochaetia bacterium]